MGEAGELAAGRADYRASLARRPDSELHRLPLARCLVSGPGRGDPDEAVRWARMAVDAEARDAPYRHILGLALYRAGRFAEAAAELEPNIPRDPTGPASTGCSWRCAGIGWAGSPTRGPPWPRPCAGGPRGGHEPRPGRLVRGFLHEADRSSKGRRPTAPTWRRPVSRRSPPVIGIGITTADSRPSGRTITDRSRSPACVPSGPGERP